MDLRFKEIIVENNGSDIINQLNDDRVEIQESVVEIEKKVCTTDESVYQNEKKMNIAFALVGVSLCISIVEFVFFLLR